MFVHDNNIKIFVNNMCVYIAIFTMILIDYMSVLMYITMGLFYMFYLLKYLYRIICVYDSIIMIITL